MQIARLQSSCLRPKSAVATFILVAAGLGFLLHGLWIPAKAALAYGLMNQAATQAQARAAPTPPWPWADFGVSGTLHFMGHTTHVLDRATGEALAFGAGRHEEIPASRFGPVLSGHRDTHFAPLEAAKAGDVIELKDYRGTHKYQITRRQVVNITQGDIRPPALDELMLITCWPFGALLPTTDERLVLLAERVNP